MTDIDEKIKLLEDKIQEIEKERDDWFEKIKTDDRTWVREEWIHLKGKVLGLKIALNTLKNN